MAAAILGRTPSASGQGAAAARSPTALHHGLEGLAVPHNGRLAVASGLALVCGAAS